MGLIYALNLSYTEILKCFTYFLLLKAPGAFAKIAHMVHHSSPAKGHISPKTAHASKVNHFLNGKNQSKCEVALALCK